MHFQDLSSYCYITVEPDTLNIGWLDGVQSYPSGNVPGSFVKRLEEFLKVTTHHSFGAHTCEICVRETWSDEIRVFGEGLIVYAAPTMIYHYVVDHHYLPPETFIRAVLEGPLPNSPEYLKRAERYEWGRMAARMRRFQR